jgi:hypothetical protein
MSSSPFQWLITTHVFFGFDGACATYLSLPSGLQSGVISVTCTDDGSSERVVAYRSSLVLDASMDCKVRQTLDTVNTGGSRMLQDGGSDCC